jgi:hypothetical protein
MRAREMGKRSRKESRDARVEEVREGAIQRKRMGSYAGVGRGGVQERK